MNTREAQNKKRKAEDGLVGRHGKVMRNNVASEQIARATSSTNAQTKAPKPPTSVSSPSAVMPSRATSRPGPTSDVLTTPTGDALKAPKKGSYAEIMARAKANQSKPPVGTISHKPKEQIAPSYKKALKMNKKAMKDKKLCIKDHSRPGSSGSLSSSPAPGSVGNKKAAAPAYKGTAKPKPQLPQPTYRGTMKPASSSIATPLTRRDRDANPSKVRYDEYAATDEDDLDDIEEDEYGSEESDDMEAGFTDVEEEETAAARAARKEDEEEARLEAKLKREKEERRKKLEQLAKKAKPQRY